MNRVYNEPRTLGRRSIPVPEPLQPLLAPEQLLDGWTPRRVGRRVITLAETNSTNNVALASCGDPNADGLAVFADYQTAGRGRQGRSWLAPRGASILCSILLRSPSLSLKATSASGRISCPPLEVQGDAVTSKEGGQDARPPKITDDSGCLTLAAAVAVCEAIRRATDVVPSIKWPNDLRVAGRKLAGILIETRVVPPGIRVWVIGIGINCYQQAGHFPPELRDLATSLDLASGHPVDRAAVARELLKALDATFRPEEAKSTEAIYSQWLTYAEPLGRRVRLRCEGREYTGRTVAVDPAGGLIVQCDDGQLQWFDPLLTSTL
jgi:BirA family biotin operon repressor/biotin-[acetyl-CoA-carboxylase] ligase